jgi:hypothetical protein
MDATAAVLPPAVGVAVVAWTVATLTSRVK